MSVMKKEMGSECPLSFLGDEHETSVRAVKGNMLVSRQLWGCQACTASQDAI